MIVLAGDIGGTNSRFIIAKREQSEFSIISEKNYLSNQFSSFEEVARRFINESNQSDKIETACFAIAGPVINGQSKITNLPWDISEKQLQQRLNINRVKLVNDFTAVALGIPWLKDEDIHVIQAGKKLHAESKPDAAIIGAGTGLGVSHRVWINNQYHILASETGHVSFAPANEQQARLILWLQEKNQQNYISLECVLSGKGIYKLYQFLRDTNQYAESTLLKDKIETNDPAKIITESALSNSDELCVKTLELFVEIYGAVAGDIALHYYPVEELYIAGGIAPKIKDKIDSSLFLEHFTDKGLMSKNLESITIKLVMNEKVGLYGAIMEA